MLKFDIRHAAFAAVALLAAARLPAQELARAPAVTEMTAIVAAANPLAADAGVEILKKGGSAADAGSVTNHSSSRAGKSFAASQCAAKARRRCGWSSERTAQRRKGP